MSECLNRWSATGSSNEVKKKQAKECSWSKEGTGKQKNKMWISLNKWKKDITGLRSATFFLTKGLLYSLVWYSLYVLALPGYLIYCVQSVAWPKQRGLKKIYDRAWDRTHHHSGRTGSRNNRWLLCECSKGQKLKPFFLSLFNSLLLRRFVWLKLENSFSWIKSDSFTLGSVYRTIAKGDRRN